MDQVLLTKYCFNRRKNFLVKDSTFEKPAYSYLTPSALPTFYFQKSLPRLQIPQLSHTLQRYTESVKCLLTSIEEQVKLEQLVAEFENGIGKELQEQLILLDKKNKTTSYISKPWFEMYLKDRRPLLINCSPAMTLAQDPSLEALPPEKRQLIRATNLLISSLRFMKSMDAGTLSPELHIYTPSKFKASTYNRIMKLIPARLATPVSIRNFNVYPLDMSQYPSMFRTTRIPQLTMDRIQRWDKKSVRHIIVMCQGHMYSIPVLDYTGKILPAAELMGYLEDILETDIENPAKHPVGSLTCQSRNEWANTRSHLIRSSGTNRKLINDVESALFVLCLDEETFEGDQDGSAKAKHFLTSSDGRNRWLDKSFQLIVTRDAWAGVLFEHSWGDGVAVRRFLNDVAVDSNQFQWANSMTSKRPAIAIREMAFELDDTTRNAIGGTIDQLAAQFQNLQINAFRSDQFGKTKCKGCGVSPDSVMQLGFQVAFQRLYKYTPATYESCSTAAFKHGRTETIRSATSFTRQISQIMDKEDWSRRKYELKELIKKSSEKHSELAKEAAIGQGFDRHLFALKNISQRKEGDLGSDFFASDGFSRMNHFVISTSTMSAATGAAVIDIAAFGPAVPDGFGISYQIRDNGLGCIVTSFADHRDGKAFVEACEQAFSDIYSILSIEIASW